MEQASHFFKILLFICFTTSVTMVHLPWSSYYTEHYKNGHDKRALLPVSFFRMKRAESSPKEIKRTELPASFLRAKRDVLPQSLLISKKKSALPISLFRMKKTASESSLPPSFFRLKRSQVDSAAVDDDKRKSLPWSFYKMARSTLPASFYGRRSFSDLLEKQQNEKKTTPFAWYMHEMTKNHEGDHHDETEIENELFTDYRSKRTLSEQDLPVDDTVKRKVKEKIGKPKPRNVWKFWYRKHSFIPTHTDKKNRNNKKESKIIEKKDKHSFLELLGSFASNNTLHGAVNDVNLPLAFMSKDQNLPPYLMPGGKKKKC